MKVSTVHHRAWQLWRSRAAASAEKRAKVQRAALLAFGSRLRRSWAGWRLRVAARRRKTAAAALAQVRRPLSGPWTRADVLSVLIAALLRSCLCTCRQRLGGLHTVTAHWCGKRSAAHWPQRCATGARPRRCRQRSWRAAGSWKRQSRPSTPAPRCAGMRCCHAQSSQLWSAWKHANGAQQTLDAAHRCCLARHRVSADLSSTCIRPRLCCPAGGR